MKISNVIECMEHVAPQGLSADWDSTGWQIKTSDVEVKAMLLSIDVRPYVVQEAINKGANLILSHHPLLFNPLKNIDLNSIKGEIIKKSVENNIAIFSAHSNLDVIQDGTSFVLAKLIGLQDIDFLVHIKDCKHLKIGWGAIGALKKTLSLGALSKKIRQSLKTDLVVALDAGKSRYHNIIAVGAGSMSDRIPDAIRQNASVYITSDVNYHEAQEALEEGLSLIIVDHFYAELPVLYRLRELLEKDIDVPIIISEAITSPFHKFHTVF
jgi:dinuclear metal center YbgI/SA1388 family protein